MEFSFSWVGMGLIILSWIVQIVYTLMRSKNMTAVFALFQAVGIGFLVYDLYLANGGMNALSYLNVGSAVGALVMFVIVLAKKS